METEKQFIEIDPKSLRVGDMIYNEYGFRLRITDVSKPYEDIDSVSAVHEDPPHKGQKAHLHIQKTKFRRLVEMASQSTVVSRYRF